MIRNIPPRTKQEPEVSPDNYFLFPDGLLLVITQEKTQKGNVLAVSAYAANDTALAKRLTQMQNADAIIELRFWAEGMYALISGFGNLIFSGYSQGQSPNWIGEVP